LQNGTFEIQGVSELMWIRICVIGGGGSGGVGGGILDIVINYGHL
jgi:hypothetical protein